MFKKSGIGMRIWQQTWGSSTAYASYVDVLDTGAGNQVKSGYIQSNNSLRAPIFYDSDNTGYYINPAATDYSGVFRQHVTIGDSAQYKPNSGNWGARLNVVDNVHAKITVGQDANDMLSVWYAHTGQSSIKFGTETSHNVEIIAGNATRLTIDTGGNVQATTSLRAPIFYDSNDTGRYVNPNGTSSLGSINMNNGNLTGVNHITINDPGPTEGISWAGGNLWRIAESPDNISTNSGGNLQIIQNSTRRATFRTDGSLNLPSGVLLSNVTSNWQQSAAKTNLLRGGNFSSTLSNDTSTIKIFPAATGRAAGNYWGGMYFMHLDPQNSSWGTSYTGGQMWIGGRVIDQPGQERSALVFATNNATGAGSHPSERMAILPDGNVVIGQTAVSYTNSDNTPLVGAKTNSKLHINGGIQLANNNDAIVFGRGTSTFMKDEEIGFGWGGGLYMTDGTYLRIRNNKIVYSTGEFRGSLFRDVNNSGYYLDPASTSVLNNLTINGTISGITASEIGATPLDHIRSLGTQAFTNGSNPNITTAQVISEMEFDGAFDSYSSVFKTSWSYAGNYNLTDAGRFTETAGSSWITWTDNSSDSARGNITALAIAPTTGASAGKVFIYNDQSSGYNPGWREVWTSTSDGAGSGLDADLWDGNQFASYLNQAVRTNDRPTFLGLTISDNIYHTGDTNTYMGFHTNDQWRVVTAGGERLEVNNDGIKIQGRINIGDTNTTLREGSGNSIKIETSTGYIDIGSMNTGWIHFQGNRNYYFNRETAFDANLRPYANNNRLLGTSAQRWSNVYAQLGNFAGNLDAGTFRDRDNTGYYLNPASTSNLNALATQYQYITGQTSNGQSHYQWEGATYRNPGTYTSRLIVRQDNTSTGINGSMPGIGSI